MSNELLEIDGYCPICERTSKFRAPKGSWLRGTLLCSTCEGGSVPRERALAHVLARERPNYRTLTLHESSPAERGISLKLKRQCKYYTPTHYFPGHPMGEIVNGFRNESIESTTFPDECFDVVLSLDVIEHIFRPEKAFADIHRTLRRGGLFISTFPIRKQQIDSHVQRAKLLESGEIAHLVEAEYHGNPIDGKGALVTFDYGYAMHQMIPHWASFDVEISRFCDHYMGVLGEYTEVIVCRKR